VADEWVRALNDEDYARACELSPVNGDVCVTYLRNEPFGTKLRIEGFTLNSHEGKPEKAAFGLSTAIQRRDAQRQAGWTAYAPLDAFSIVQGKDGLRVNWNPAEIVVAEGMLPCERGAELVDALGKPDQHRARLLAWELDSAQAGIGPAAWFLEVALNHQQQRVVRAWSRIRPV
jgi:hypothetical protein